MTITEIEGGLSEKSFRNGENHDLLALAKDLPAVSGSLAPERIQKRIAAAATGSILSSPYKQNGNQGLRVQFAEKDRYRCIVTGSRRLRG
jgi:hypothetical protein